MNERIRWRLRFTGKVQHVGFRYTAFYLARQLYLTGWVDNLPDGSVELEAQGSPAMLRKFLLQIKAQPHIQIRHTELAQIPPLPHERHFEVRGYHTDLP